MNDKPEQTKASRDWWRLRLSTLFMAITIFAVLCAWIIDRQNLNAQIERALNIDEIAEMPDSTLLRKMQLREALVWHMPNQPPGSFQTTYYLDGGDLDIQIKDDTFYSVTFYPREDSPQERLDAVHKGWGEYVRQRSPNRVLPNNTGDNSTF